MYVCKLRVAQITFVLNEITHPFDTTEKRYSYIIQLKEHEAFIYIHIYIFKLYDMSFNMDWKENNNNIYLIGNQACTGMEELIGTQPFKRSIMTFLLTRPE